MGSSKVANKILRVISASNFGIRSKGNEINSETEISIQRLHSKQRKIHGSEQLHHSKLVDPSYKEDSPRADTEIQIMLLPKGSNPGTFREEKACCKKICMIRNITNPLLAPALLPDMFCNKNNTISPEAIEGETTKTSTQRMAPTDHKSF